MVASTSTSLGLETERTLGILEEFIMKELEEHRGRNGKGKSPEVEPLFVALQGVQGCGKSFLTSHLLLRLSLPPHNLTIATLSLDDLYLPHASLQSLASAHPTNKLLQGRGPAGTHDLPLAERVMSELKAGRATNLPMFEKSAFGGKGDRSKEEVKVEGKVDLVLFEGWMVGFRGLEEEELKSKYEEGKFAELVPSPSTTASKSDFKWGYEKPFYLEHEFSSLEKVNEYLGNYNKMWDFCHVFVQLVPGEIKWTFEWRLEQEHNMKSKNGGIGMTDSQVHDFIARYMPAYELYLPSLQSEESSWKGRGLKMILSKDRSVHAVERF